MDEPLFARGFTITRAGDAPHADWIRREIGDWTLAHDTRVPFHSARSGTARVAVLGFALDTASWVDGQVAVRVAAAALGVGENAFLDVIDGWSGRHLIVWSRGGGQPHVMTDATGMRTCFFTRSGELMAASHAPLLARLAAAGRARYTFLRHPRFPRGIFHYPGRLTPWREVVFLTPNTALSLDGGDVRRVWPRAQLGERAVDEAAGIVTELTSGQMRFLVDTGRPVAVSLTGGLDSRTTLAASREVAGDLDFFTYCAPGNPANEDDLAVARTIADAAGITHRVIELPADSAGEDERIMRALAENTFLQHLFVLAAAYRREFSQETIHVRSNIAEVARRGLDKHGRDLPFTKPAHMARTWKGMRHDVESVAAFDEWADAVSFWEVEEIDLLELFHWEHRIQCWHGCLILESDIAFDTHAPLNSRVILETLLSVPLKDRRRASVFSTIIGNQWPEVAGIRRV